MRHFGIGRMGHASRDRDSCFVPDRQSAHGNEAFQVLWEIGIHLAAFLGIALVVNVLLVLFGVVPAPA